MANLLNKYIYETYKSIIGIGQSGTSGVSGVPQALTDGEGHELPIKVSETDVELGFTTTKNIFIEAYGEVIDQNGNWTGPTAGLAGTSGTSGTSGHAGTSGTSGTSGHAGANGTNGTSGTSGYTGSSGVAGTSGTSGTSGVNGAPGTQNLIVDNIGASVGTVLPTGEYYGVINISAPDTSIYQPDNAQNSIALGYYGACFEDAIYLGHYGQAGGNSIVIGHQSYSNDGFVSIIGHNTGAGSNTAGSIIYGCNNSLNGADDVDSFYSIILGNELTGAGKKNIVIASQTSFSGDYNTIIGNATIVGNESIAFGTGDPSISSSNLIGDRNISFGKYNSIEATGGIAIGNNVSVTANGAIAIGNDFTAQNPDTLTTKKLQLLDTIALDYANDTIAAANGVPLAGIYHTSGILKIRIA